MFDFYHFPFGITLYLYLVTSFSNSLEQELLEIGDDGDDERKNEGDLLHRLQLDFFLFAFVSMLRLKETVKATFSFFNLPFFSFSLFDLL